MTFLKTIFVRNYLTQHEFDLLNNVRAGETDFHLNGFAREPVLTQMKKGNLACNAAGSATKFQGQSTPAN